MQLFELNSPFHLESGEVFPTIQIAYQTFGNRKTAQKIIWVCHALTGNTDVSAWWAGLFGSNRAFDPQKDFIICANVLGSPYGSTSPLSIQPNGKPYLLDFPLVTTRDIAKSFQLLRKHLFIDNIDLIIGASLGGQQAIEWLALEPQIFKNSILIATNVQHSPYGIAFNSSQRLSLLADPTFDGKNTNGGQNGLIAARSIALLSYRSYSGYRLTQSENTNDKLSDFKAASYQQYQGEKLLSRFNAYAYHTLTKTMDAHNIARGKKEPNAIFNTLKSTNLVIGISSDLLFPPSEQKTICKLLPNSKYKEIDSDFGHDGFLVESDLLNEIILEFIQNEIVFIKEKTLSQ